MKTAPAFMFYASDAIADKRYRLMTLPERGLYLSMLSECWVNRAMPTAPADIAQWLGYSVDEINAALTERVRSFFVIQEGELVSPELERYRNGLEERRQKMSKGGKLGADKKWNKTAPDDGHPNSPPNGVTMGSRVEKSRVEKNRGESLKKGLSPEAAAWVNDYAKASNGG